MLDEGRLLAALTGDAFWESYLLSVVASGAARVHLGIFVEPYLSYVLDGSKTVESRFAKRATAPYGRVNTGDVVLLKRSGGQVEGICLAADAWCYELNPGAWEEVLGKFLEPMRVTAEFLASRSSALYVTLIRLEEVYAIPPLPVRKRDRRGWVILRDAVSDLADDTARNSQLLLNV